MPKFADTTDVQALAEQGAQLVEVLPSAAYEEEHLPGAVNIPLGDFSARTLAQLDPGKPVVVYCYDHECDLSARAAHLLEAFGFTDVYEYTASKVAWMANGLPMEGTKPDSSRAGAIASPIPSCDFTDRVGDLEGRFDDHDLVIVTNDNGVLLGVVRREVLQLPAETAVSEVLQPAPPSVRPSITASELNQSMADDDRTYVLVTHVDGVLIGVIERHDLYGQH